MNARTILAMALVSGTLLGVSSAEAMPVSAAVANPSMAAGQTGIEKTAVIITRRRVVRRPRVVVHKTIIR